MKHAAAQRPVPWSSLWRGGVLAVFIAFAFSTQLLAQADLYANWPLSAILAGWLDHLVDQLIVAAAIFGVVALASILPPAAASAKHVQVVAAIAAGAIAGEYLVILRLPLPEGVSTAAVLLAKSARWTVIGVLAYALFVLRRQAAEAAALAHASELHRVQNDLQMTQARLQSLRAYIEPHFLFNTFANVRELYRTEPARGRAMLRNFVAYVRSALPQMRDSPTTLRQDIELARAYLGVLQVRMGERLAVRFDVADDVAVLPFPALALATLIENAIKHGLNPLPEGGTIEISARRAGDRLTVQVADTGAGLRTDGGSGSGLANLRARLEALYGERAALELRANTPRGILATISIPAADHGRGLAA